MAISAQFHKNRLELLKWLEELEKAYIVKSGLWGIGDIDHKLNRPEFWQGRIAGRLNLLNSLAGADQWAQEECRRLRQRYNLVVARGETWCDSKFLAE